jgi:hypothetical protein
MEEGNTTHIKFGGYDPEGIIGGEANDLKFLKTSSQNTWAIDLGSASIGSTTFTNFSSKERKALFELAYPYIYLP